ncbi:YtkA-like [Piscibacillus halophilus]|uniref:YtkA-like n=2 Tax=Piscibacillus halophilus TaxID=571933 RepID=A0A1H9J0A9_9BACI|nr:YtkA-like [Piscibacillus halophilus]
MMKKIIWICLIGFITLLVACNEQKSNENKHDNENSSHETNNDEDHNEDISLVPVKVEILVDGEIELGEETLQARVLHDDEPIAEADEVIFEVWETGHEDESEMVEASHTKDGIYEASYPFEKEGTYEMYAHVTANSQHVMPKHEFEVIEK